MLFKLSHLNSNLALTLGYLNPALNNSAQKFSFLTKLMAMHNRLIKTAAANSIAASLYVHLLWVLKKIQEPAVSKITQQKGSVNYKKDSIDDSITHCGVAVVNSLGNLRWRRFRDDGDRTGRESLELRQPSLPVKNRTLRSQWTQMDGAFN